VTPANGPGQNGRGRDKIVVVRLDHAWSGPEEDQDVVVGGANPTAVGWPGAPAEADSARVLQLLWTISGLELLMVTRAEPSRDLQHVHAALLDGRPTALRAQSWSGSLCVHLAAGTGPAVASDLASVPLYADAPNVADAGLTSYVGALVLRPDGGLFGTVCGFGRAPRGEQMHDLLPSFRTAAALLGSTIAAAHLAEERLTDARHEHDQVLREALTDPVTGLLNRTGLEQASAREDAHHRRDGHVVTVVVCDVDGLKRVNDTAGHPAGDVLLHAVAQALRETVRARDVLGRAGGDEFVVLMPEASTDGEDVARVRAALLELPVSVGVADTSGGRTLAQARAQADATMYRAKAERRPPAARSAPRRPGALVPGLPVLDADGSPLGTVHHVFRELASGAPSWAAVRTGTDSRLVAVPLAGSAVVDRGLMLPHPREQVLGSPPLRAARVMSETERLVLAAWYAPPSSQHTARAGVTTSPAGLSPGR
jgi:diguanylate cyclase (GGDEF)-like protein